MTLADLLAELGPDWEPPAQLDVVAANVALDVIDWVHHFGYRPVRFEAWWSVHGRRLPSEEGAAKIAARLRWLRAKFGGDVPTFEEFVREPQSRSAGIRMWDRLKVRLREHGYPFTYVPCEYDTLHMRVQLDPVCLVRARWVLEAREEEQERAEAEAGPEQLGLFPGLDGVA